MNRRDIYGDEIPYKDMGVQIGDTVTCVSLEQDDSQHLTVGKKYKIVDLDFHFPTSICINTDSGISMFMKARLFECLRATRKKKLNKISNAKSRGKDSL